MLVFVDHYLPGYKSGGPLRTIAAAIEEFGDRFDFRVVTLDRDAGDTEPFAMVSQEPRQWIRQGGAQVWYLPPRAGFHEWRAMLRALRDLDRGVVYCNSLLSRRSLLLPLVLGRLGVISRSVLIAPRGELDPGALAMKGLRKRTYLRALHPFLRSACWHASTPAECTYIRRYQPRAVVHVAIDNHVRRRQPARFPRPPASPLEAVFISRISPKKNLDGLLRSLRFTINPCRLTIYGPAPDRKYWEHCQTLIERVPSHVDVIYKGSLPHDQIESVLETADVMILPTHGENFGHVIAEALGAGCPVIISDKTPWTELVQPHAGVVVTPHDEVGLAAAIDNFAVLDSNQYHQAQLSARRAYERSAQTFSGDLADLLVKVDKTE